jgi:hypothetical protein
MRRAVKEMSEVFVEYVTETLLGQKGFLEERAFQKGWEG